jgi:hypothetical protein
MNKTIYKIYLYQSTGEVQTPYDSESKEEILKLWKQECSVQDEYTPLDESLELCKVVEDSETDDEISSEVIDSYIITEAQQDN